MKIRKPLILAVLMTISTIGFSQVVASIDASSDYSMNNTVLTSQLTYKIVDAESNVQFSKVNYSTVDQQLTLDTNEEVQFITLLKDDQYYLTNMPVFSQKLRVSMKNYEPGTYELHLKVKGKIVPTILDIKKK